MNSKGNYWFKCDFHVHTPDDPQWHQKPGNADEQSQFIENFIREVKENDLKLIAITDHFNYQDYLTSYLAKIYKRSQNEEFSVIPGCEISAKDGRSGTHVLILFSPTIGENCTKLFTRINHILIQLHPSDDRTTNNQIPLSKNNISEMVKLLDEEIPNQFLLLFAHVDGNNGVLQELRGHVRIETWNTSKIQIAQWKKNPCDYNSFYDSIGNNTHNDFDRKIHVLGSDCRSLNPIKDSPNIIYLGQKYTWIKTIPSFQGLLHLFQDPEGLIELSDENPVKRQKQYFYQITLDNDRIFDDGKVSFPNTQIDLNRDMVALIGSRGTGKSLFLNVFAKVHQLKNDFCENIQKMRLKPTIQVGFEKEDATILQSSVNNPNELEYIHVCQGEFKEICKDELRMNLEIEKLLQISRFLNTPSYDEEIQSLTNQFISTLKWINHTNEAGQFINSIQYHRRIIDSLKKKLELLQTKETKKMISDLQENIKKLDKYEKNYSNLQHLEERFKQDLKPIIRLIEKLNKSLDKKITPVDISIQKDEINQFKKNLAVKMENLNQRNDKIKKEFEDLGIDDSYFKIGQIKKIENNKLAHEEAIKQIREKLADNDSIFPQLYSYFLKLKDRMEEYKTTIDNIWSELKSSKFKIPEQKEIHKQLLANIEIKPILFFDKNKFLEILKTSLNLGKFRDKESISQDERIKKTFIIRNTKDLESLLANNKIIQYEDEEPISLSEFVSDFDFFKSDMAKEFLNKLFLSENLEKYYRVLCKIYFKGKEPNSLSMGERGTLYLRLKLATAKFTSPFIFDQPEDDLDNDFIQDILVPLLRKIKNYRQLIIATHNANIVVNGNADQVIVCKNNDENLSYEAGTICDDSIRDSICTILEGGEKALKKRARKYGFLSYSE